MKSELIAYASSVPLVVASVACGSSSTDRPRSVDPIATATSPTPRLGASVPVIEGTALASAAEPSRVGQLESAMARVEALGVDPKAVGRRVLLSWTTRKQAEEIVGGQPILTRIESAKLGPSGFDWALDAKVAKGDRLAKLLFHEGFAKKRFAWPNAYSTALGAGGGRYGAVLMRIELKDDALIADMVTGTIVTVDSKPVPFEDVEAHPQRLAAVYWESPEFREYVVVNEAALANVSFGTPDALEVFENEKKVLNDVVSVLTTASGGQEADLVGKVAKTLAFAKTSSTAMIKALAKEANEVPPDSLAHSVTPKKEFGLGAQRARLKSPGCKLTKNYDFSYTRTICQPSDRCRTLGGGKCEIWARSLHELED